MNKIMFLLFLATGIIGCSVESLDTNETLKSNNEVFEVNAIYEIDGFETTTWDLVKYHGNDSSKDDVKGKIYVTNDCENLYIKIEGANEANLGLYQDQSDFPSKNGKNENVTPDLQYDEEDTTNFLWTFPLTDFEDVSISIFANAGGHSWGGDEEWGNAFYFVYKFQLDSCEEVCAYGKGYWTNHGPINPGNQENAYPEGSVEIGGILYEYEDLQEILKENGNTGQVFKMKQHLITVLLNIANGVDGSSMESVIAEANAIITADGEGYTSDEINAIKNELEKFNDDNACDDYEDYENED